MVFHALTFARSRERCCKLGPKTEVFNNYRGTWQMMHWKTMFDCCYCIYSTTMLNKKMFVKQYAPNHMPDPKGEWSLKENNSELHYGICSKVNQFIYTLV